VWFEHVTLGTVAVSPDATEARDAVERARRTAALMAAWTGPGATSDGHPVSILANVQDGAAARAARETPAEGVGLFPIELCFLNRETEPSVAEQAQIYGEVLEAFSGTRRQRARNELEPVGTKRGVSERITAGAPVLINAHRGIRPQAQRPLNAAPPRYALCRIVWPQSAGG